MKTYRKLQRERAENRFETYRKALRTVHPEINALQTLSEIQIFELGVTAWVCRLPSQVNYPRELREEMRNSPPWMALAYSIIEAGLRIPEVAEIAKGKRVTLHQFLHWHGGFVGGPASCGGPLPPQKLGASFCIHFSARLPRNQEIYTIYKCQDDEEALRLIQEDQIQYE